MRLKSELWVKAYIRRCSGAGSPAVVVRRGDTDAGVILIRIARLDGSGDLYGPAPSGYVADEGSGGRDRSFVVLASKAPDADIDKRVASEIRLDSDLWLIEVEDRAGRAFLDGWLAKP